MGTNTFHLLIVDLMGGDFKVMYREKIAVRLGKDGISKGSITPEAWKRALDTLTTFTQVIKEFNAGTGLCGHLRLRECFVDSFWNNHHDALKRTKQEMARLNALQFNFGKCSPVLPI